jgi:anti-anti-sigma regulatory factor
LLAIAFRVRPDVLAMTFRVQRASFDDSVLLRLSGDIAGDHAAELQALLEAERDHHLTLDLAEAAVVDRIGVRLLAHSESAGATLANCPPYVRSGLIDNETGS